MSTLERKEGAEDKTYTRDGLIIFLFNGFESLGCRNDFVMNDVNVNLIVLNDLDRVNKLVAINLELHELAINRMCRSLDTLISKTSCDKSELKLPLADQPI